MTAEPLVGGIGLHETNLPTVHACRQPCWLQVVGGKPVPPGAWNYLMVERPDDLYLNMIDAEARFFRPELFRVACDFIDRHHGAVAVHCNEGRSRAPSIALVWLALRADEIPEASYRAARAAYEERDPDYAPGVGIAEFLTERWEDLR